MPELKTASGKKFECDYFGHSERHRQANIRILNTPISTLATIFSNSAETCQLWWENDYAAGFTKFLSFVNEGDAIRIVLGKE